MSKIQRTLVVLKPDTVGRGLIGEVISRLERAGLHIIGMKMQRPTAEFLHEHYEGIGKLGERRGQDVLENVIEMMSMMPLVAMCVEGIEAVDFVRKIVGSTEPKSAAAGTIRGDFAHISYGHIDGPEGRFFFNLVHASADAEEAAQEVPLWFSEEELFSEDKPSHFSFTR